MISTWSINQVSSKQLHTSLANLLTSAKCSYSLFYAMSCDYHTAAVNLRFTAAISVHAYMSPKLVDIIFILKILQ